MRYLDRYGIELPSVYENVLKDYPRKPWNTLITEHNKKKCTDEALDLLTKLLQYDHQVKLIIIYNVASSNSKRSISAPIFR